MTDRVTRRSRVVALALTVLGLVSVAQVLAACGSDDEDDTAADESAEDGSDESGDEATDDGSDDGADDGDAQNACPADGCLIDFASVEASDAEIEVVWDINFAPDINGNHIHIYWDNFEPAQVSNDATDREVDQGEWVPTDEDPYITGGAASTDPAVRGDSTTLCVVAADRDHNVIDEATEVCRDVSDLL